MWCTFLTEKRYYDLVIQIKNNPEAYFSIVANPDEKHALANRTSTQLPHWLLSIAQTNPHIAEHFINDPVLKASLTSDELTFLFNNCELISTETLRVAG